MGDLGNIEAPSSGLTVLDIHDRLALLDGPASILGKAIVIHEGLVLDYYFPLFLPPQGLMTWAEGETQGV